MALRFRSHRHLQARVHEALQAQLGYNALWSDNTSRRLGEILVNGRRLITQRDLETALAIQKRTRRKLGQILLALGKLNDRDLLLALEQQHNLRDPWRQV